MDKGTCQSLVDAHESQETRDDDEDEDEDDDDDL